MVHLNQSHVLTDSQTIVNDTKIKTTVKTESFNLYHNPASLSCSKNPASLATPPKFDPSPRRISGAQEMAAPSSPPRHRSEPFPFSLPPSRPRHRGPLCPSTTARRPRQSTRCLSRSEQANGGGRWGYKTGRRRSVAYGFFFFLCVCVWSIWVAEG